MSILEVKKVSKKFGKFSLTEISLEIEKEYFVLLGPTGAGKSVLLEIIAGILTPDKGEIILNGRDITHLPPEKRRIGLVPQDYALFPHLNVFKNIEYGLKARRIRDSSRVYDLAEKLHIEHLLGRNPTSLSGGERQRVALARALAVEPELLLLDEPLSAVDLKTKEMLMEELRRVHFEFGIPIIHVTHSFIEAVLLAKKVAVIMGGRIMHVSEVKDLFSARNKEVAEFVAVGDLFEKMYSFLKLEKG
ncbi:MAG: ATP-binding cassette domain-containing protein [Archaeoglobus sp.]|nr:ATP-binding cassette domain-containing protein [Archaeoglobus sp.]